MVDYNTHGGYFAPQGLMKINEGGSHEENPNGGVQLGVDQQGIPNLVEEDEMVYNDFVYSDNIKADGGFLEKNNLPKKYAGKFYSEIAEALCDEIGEQNDPISLNGLNASLGRLASSQEEQKAAEEEAELMKMLQEMSPEELAALEQAFVEQQAPEQPMVPEEQIQPEVMPEQVGAEEVTPEQIAPAVPMMANGGLLNTFDGGGRVGNKGQMALNFLRDVADFISPVKQKEIVLPDGSVGKVQYAVPPMVSGPAARLVGATKVKKVVGAPARAVRNGVGKVASSVGKGIDEAKTITKGAIESGSKATKEVREALDFAKEQRSVIKNQIIKEVEAGREVPAKLANKYNQAVNATHELRGEAIESGAENVLNHVMYGATKMLPGTGALKKAGQAIRNIPKGVKWGAVGATALGLTALGAANAGRGDDEEMLEWDANHMEQSEPEVGGTEFKVIKRYGNGGPANIYAKDGQMETIKPAYKVGFKKVAQDPYYYFGARRNPELNVLNNYRLINPATYGDDLLQMAGSNWLNRHLARGYGNTIQYVPKVFNLGDLDEAIITPPSGPSHGTSSTRAGNNTTPVSIPDVQPLLSDADLDAIINDASQQPDPRGLYVGHGMYMPSELVNRVNSTNIPIKDTEINVPKLSGPANRNTNDSNSFDWRYLSPAIDAAMGLATLATPEDHYEYNPIRPYLPYGRIRQQYERYNPLDQNMVTNQMQAQANATMAALRNAGLGPSTGAQMIGAGYAAGQNMGNALANVWDANNQRYNQVVNQHNAADSTTAQFDWGVESARANALNQFAPYNQRMALQTQMLNNQAEQDKYNAIGSYVDSAKQFFANKGTEDLNRNMVNSNRAFLGYGIDRMNNVIYDKYGNPILLAKCGGSIKKK